MTALSGRPFVRAKPNPREVIQLLETRARAGGDGMGFKLTGLSEVTINLEQLKKALDGAVAKVSFDPSNRQDVERAIREVEQKVDMKMAPYMTSPGVREIAAGLKEEYRKAILHKAEQARRKSPS
jgi:hypothetical protein